MYTKEYSRCSASRGKRSRWGQQQGERHCGGLTCEVLEDGRLRLVQLDGGGVLLEQDGHGGVCPDLLRLAQSVEAVVHAHPALGQGATWRRQSQEAPRQEGPDGCCACAAHDRRREHTSECSPRKGLFLGRERS